MQKNILGSGKVETFTTSLHAVMKVRYYSTPGFREETSEKTNGFYLHPRSPADH